MPQGLEWGTADKSQATAEFGRRPAAKPFLEVANSHLCPSQNRGGLRREDMEDPGTRPLSCPEREPLRLTPAGAMEPGDVDGSLCHSGTVEVRREGGLNGSPRGKRRRKHPIALLRWHLGLPWVIAGREHGKVTILPRLREE
ncbi:hypothetical protein NDU88_006333 [Pleurodeles waltl]|uniref:Uncharacterized protein n=1 Tax=Pleurodeles waltl TaxID=8319 RepID=A0AAV7SP83_PLEWA|nr:hypothetical protein NDU88_006333 [Pleurodeles waltl]